MNDRHDLESTLRRHQPRIDPEVKRHVLREFNSRRPARRWRRTLALAATLALLLSASFYAGRLSADRGAREPTASTATTTIPWCTAQSDVL
jgi:hypothetical protein